MRQFRVRITWNDGEKGHIEDELVEVAEYWRVYPILLARNAIPEHKHTLEVWEITSGTRP